MEDFHCRQFSLLTLVKLSLKARSENVIPTIFLCVELFSLLPAACLISDRVLVLHGGLSSVRDLNLNDIRYKERKENCSFCVERFCMCAKE